MAELQWKKKDFSTGAISFNSHDYISNSELWIKDASFMYKKNGWELYDSVDLLGEGERLGLTTSLILNPYDPHKILRA